MKIMSLVGVAALLAASPAFAQQGGQFASVEWGDRYDSGSSAVQAPTSHTVPLLSSQTLQATEAALQLYYDIESRGGWPMVPAEQTLKLGTRSPNVVALRQRLIVSQDLPANSGMSDVMDTYVDAAVRGFQKRHGIIVTGVVDAPTFQALNVPASVRRRQLELNIDRLRKMASAMSGSRFVMVNIPGAEIEAVEGGVLSTRHAGVVGKADRPSPVHSVRIVDVNFNPFWTVPASIIRKDLIPKMQEDPNYLTDQKIRIYDRSGAELQPAQVNWNTMEATNYMFRQDPGDLNSMGTVRINMPNSEQVYMHDTPSKGLFGENSRFHSSGCVRVQNVRELVEFLLRPTGSWSRQQIDAAIRSGERHDVKLAQPVTVHWVYMTAWSSESGVVQFREDIYNKDGMSEVAAATVQ